MADNVFPIQDIHVLIFAAADAVVVLRHDDLIEEFTNFRLFILPIFILFTQTILILTTKFQVIQILAPIVVKIDTRIC